MKPLLVPSPLVTRDDRVSPRPTMSTSTNRPIQRKTPASSPAEEKVAAGGLPPPPPPATTSSPKQEMQDALVTAEALAT